MKPKIYDCFNFYNEIEILEIRLNILYDYVDYFVIVQGDITHSGDPKIDYFNENKHRFQNFLDKIIIYNINDTPNEFYNLTYKENDITYNKIIDYIKIQTNRFNIHTQNDYGRDFFQKESVKRPIYNICNDNDIIIFSDADEIPNPEILKNINNLDLENYRYSLNQNMYCYFINVFKENTWYGSKISSFKNIKNISLNELRGDENYTIKVPNGGWHFSFMGGYEMVKNKLNKYSARDLVNQYIINNIENNINNNIDPFFRQNLTVVQIDNTYPEYIINNQDKYKHLIK